MTQMISGPIDRVPCPWCGKPNDFRDIQGQSLLDNKETYFCDHCAMSMQVVAVRTVELVSVRKDASGKRAPVAAPGTPRGPQRQLPPKQPGFLQKLLGGGK